jgi:glucan phosphoethanolaminetransferase (alkaline phosphatase superfamily)
MLTTASELRRPAGRSAASVAGLLLALGVAACLAVDAYVHLHDASDYSAVRTSVLSQADLFRIQAGLAILLAVAILVRPWLWIWLAAAALLASAATAVVVYTYVDVGQIGPVPNMYEPTWALPGKVASAWAEGIGAVLAIVGFLLVLRRRRAVP